MESSTKPIRITKHAKAQLVFRGGTEYEVIDAIRTAKWGPVELGRLECRKDFTFDSMWNNKPYKTKQVLPIFVEEQEIVVVTVYVYYF